MSVRVRMRVHVAYTSLGPIRDRSTCTNRGGWHDRTAVIGKEASDKGSRHRREAGSGQQPGRPPVASRGAQEAGDRELMEKEPSPSEKHLVGK